MTTLDLGSLVGFVRLDDVQWRTTYTRVVREMANLGGQAERSTVGTTSLDRGLAEVAATSDAAAAGLGGVSTTLTEAGLSASRTAAATHTANAAIGATVDVTTEAGLATSKLTQAQLRLIATGERLTTLQEAGTASTGRLAAAQASLIASADRAALAEDRLAKSTTIAARSRAMWLSIPGPVKIAAAAIAVAGVEAVKAAADYQKLTVNLVTGAGESERNLHMVSDGILHMAGQVGFGADTLAKAMFLVESAGFHGAAALTELKTAAEGAKVDNADLTTVVDALTSAMNAYHEPTTRAAQVTNTLIASAAVGKMHLQDLAASLGTVLPSAAALRVPLDQVGAALATMTMQGTNADRAATYLRFAFAALANPTAKAQASMKAVGLTSEQVANTMTHGGLPAVFELLQTAVGQKFPAGSAKYLAALANMVGGTRGLQAVLELTGKNLTSMQGNLHSIQDRVKAAGNSVSDWSRVQQNLNVQWSKFVDGLGAAGIKLGEDLIPAATALLQVLNGTIHAVGDVTGFFDHNTIAAAALAGALSALLIPKVVEMTVWLGRVIALNSAAAFIALRAAVVEAAAAFTTADGAIAGMGAALAALDLNPVVLALAAVAAAGVVMWRELGGGARGEERHAATAVDNYVRSLGILHTSLASAQAGLADITAHTRTALSTFGSGNIDHQVGALKEWAKQGVAAADAVKKISANEQGLQTQFGLSRRAVEKLASAYGIDLTGSYQQVAGALQSALTPTQQITEDTRLLGKAAQGSADEVKALTSALDLFAGNAISADQGAIAFRNDIAALDKALHKSKGALDLNTQAGRDARDAFDSAAQQALNTAEAQAKLKDGTDKARTTLQNEIKTLRDHAGGSDYAKAAIDRLTAALHHLPGAADGRKQGAEFGQGYADGIISKREQADAAASDLALAAKAGVHRTQKSGSPSKVAMEEGSFFGQGYALGIDGAGQMVAGAAAGLAIQAAAAAHAAIAGLPTGTTVTYHQLTRPAREAAALMREVTRANNESADAAKRHAQALSDEAHQAHEAAANLRGNTKSAEKAKHAAEVHARALDDEARAAQQAASKIGTANTQNEQALQHLVDVATKLAGQVHAVEQQVSGNLLSSLDLSNAVVNGRVGNLSGFLGAGVTPLRRLSHDEARLRKLHLDPQLIAQIAGAGPTAGLALAQSILSGRSGSIQHLDVLERQARNYAKATGRTVAAAEYGRQSLDELRKLNAGIHAVKQLLESNPHATGRQVADAIDQAFRGAQHRHASRSS